MRIVTSKESVPYIDKFTRLFNFESDSIIARIAYVHSVNSGKRFELNLLPFIDRTGKDFYSETNLFGKNSLTGSNLVIYKAILEQTYERVLSEEQFKSLFILHLNHGLEVLNEQISDNVIASGQHVNFLIKLIQSGLEKLNSDSKTLLNSEKIELDLPECASVAEFEIGKDESGSPVIVRLNDLKQFDSHHIAIAGMNGSGKTELLKDILYQISLTTEKQLKFIFFDYKGVGDPNGIKSFLEATDCKFVDASKEEEYELNPMSYIKSGKEHQIISFVESISAIARLGNVQEMNLREIIRGFFNSNSNKNLSVGLLNQLVRQFYEESDMKADSLVSIMDNLSATKPFSDKDSGGDLLFSKSIYLNLPPVIPDLIRQLVVFLTLRFILEKFGNAADTIPDENKIKPLRYVVVIDEAHIYLAHPKARRILKLLLQTMRSKGVVIVMLTQEVKDFKTTDYDFASQIKIPITLNVQNKELRLMKTFLGTPKSEISLEEALNRLDNGLGITNFSEPKLIKVNQFWQRHL